MIFSHVLYQLSYLAVQRCAREGVHAKILVHETLAIKGRGDRVLGLLLSKAVELEGGLEHLLWEGADDGLWLLARLE